jgi:hypothetical protein
LPDILSTEVKLISPASLSSLGRGSRDIIAHRQHQDSRESSPKSISRYSDMTPELARPILPQETSRICKSDNLKYIGVKPKTTPNCLFERQVLPRALPPGMVVAGSALMKSSRVIGDRRRVRAVHGSDILTVLEVRWMMCRCWLGGTNKVGDLRMPL